MSWIQLSRIYKMIPRSPAFLSPGKFNYHKNDLNNNFMTLNNGKIMNFDKKLNLKQITCDSVRFKQIDSTSSLNQAEVKKEVPVQILSKKLQLKQAFKDYGGTIIIFHVTISLISLQICYLLVSSGLDVVAVMKFLGVSEETFSNKIASGASTFVIAYAVHKVFAPVRISITLGATPFIVKFLRRKGYLKQKPQ